MIDHAGITVSDFKRSKPFYLAALAPLNYTLIYELDKSVTGTSSFLGFGENQKPDFWLSEGAAPKPTNHIAFLANSRAAVDAFYKTAIAAGGKDNGAPGIRPHYHAHYYGAFVLDPDGYNIEAVCHKPE
jgi:catechol 2,3-dioxygenase-like lactoylglutathione lyase family enzyme